MRMVLHFCAGRLVGEGRDAVGDFVLSGSYTTSDGGCRILKSYLGSHDVDYDGVAAAGADGIRGVWTIWQPGTRIVDGRGPFHLWPTGEGGAEYLSLHAEEPLSASQLARGIAVISRRE